MNRMNEYTIREQYRRAYRAHRMLRLGNGKKAQDMGLFDGVQMIIYMAARQTCEITYAKERANVLQKALKQYKIIQCEQLTKCSAYRLVSYLERRIDDFEAALEAAGYHHEDNPAKLLEALGIKETL